MDLMCSNDQDKAPWTRKGATLSDKTAQKEFGLTEKEIVQAIQSEKLQYRQNNLYGNPYFKLLRTEVEALVTEKYGHNYLEKKRLETELSKVNTEIRALKRKLSQLEKRREELLQKKSSG
jgi:hypothetical protein